MERTRLDALHRFMSPEPFSKWPGGKRALLPELVKRLPAPSRWDSYGEFFVGGGALFFRVARMANCRRAILADKNERLVVTYRALRNRPAEVIGILQELQRRYWQSDRPGKMRLFYFVRDRFNGQASTDAQRAADFIFLSKAGFNGLYREDSSGRYNVAHGDYEFPNICDPTQLKLASRALQLADIQHGDFTGCLETVTGRMVVYLDPPYRPLSPTANFTSYVAGEFTEADQKRLAGFAVACREQGAFVMVSNSYLGPGDDFYQIHYPGFAQHIVNAPRFISVTVNGRGTAQEVLLIGGQDDRQ
ncbi:MAG: Modification methylase DpnIIA [Anaerolineae bacterium]|nr:Modification methylase DpnIIA [Anaerolineae bacterium]